MAEPSKPRFVIKRRFQKGGSYKALLPRAVLADICRRITGRTEFSVEFDDAGYNIGRLVMLYFQGTSHYISISETSISSRNASLQSFPSALSRYLLDKSRNKKIYFYVHPESKGNFATDYFIFMYRLMETAGVGLLNISEHVAKGIKAFADPEDVIAAKEALRSKARGNRSTYVTTGPDGAVQIFAKTYGANKYEATLICIALAKISAAPVELYEVEEGGLKSLPETSRLAILAAGAVSIASSNVAVETADFIENNSLRSIRYIYNLLERFEKKACAFCDCQIPQIVQGAHVWPVASIKKMDGLTLAQQLDCAIDGHNGLWLCGNHHKLFDTGMIFLSATGTLKYRTSLPGHDIAFLRRATPKAKLSAEFLSPAFLGYLNKRNAGIRERAYADIIDPNPARGASRRARAARNEIRGRLGRSGGI